MQARLDVPVLNNQSGDALEFLDVIGDQNER
jgi:hypothetical protein